MKSATLTSLLPALILAAFSLPSLAACPAILDHEMKRLHSSESMNLCSEFAGKPLLVVNTASHCGFTPQFKSLEAMHQRYKDRGIGFLGVASNSFNQESPTEKGAAEVCYINYGVTFPMAAPVPVKGDDAHPLFRALAEQSRPPRWNFNKYVLDRDGEVSAVFDSSTKPDDPQITELLEQLAAEQRSG
jgi:glutathione peroxidase